MMSCLPRLPRRCLRPLLWLAFFAGVASAAQAQTGLLNDTGQTSCYNTSDAAVACDAASTGNASSLPRQDGRFGRDAAAAGSALTKVGAGAAGFDFTRVCHNGTLNCTGPANTTASPAATDWACTKDNVTNLIWSLESGRGNWTTYASATLPTATNAANRCGYATGWRLPTRRELLSIVHLGLASGPMVDAAYFPGTKISWYWTADPFLPDPADAWAVNFDYGITGNDDKADNGFVRLVRGGQ